MAIIETMPKDEELVRAVLAGDVQAFDTLVERYFGMVYVIAYARLGHRETVEDLAQEVFLRAYLFLNNLQQPHYFSAWLSRIARNLASDWLRRGQRASRLIPMVPMEELTTEIVDTKAKGARQQMEEKEQNKAVREAIIKLPPELREMVMLHYTEELSKKEIARILRVHPATVGRQLKKALAMMKGMLEPILRESAPALRAPRKATVRTVALIGAAAVMSAKTKAALAAAAGGVAKLTSAQIAKSGGITAIGTILGLLKTTPATIATGVKIMGVGKGIAITVTTIAIVGGGGYYYYQQKSVPRSSVVAKQDISSALTRATQEPIEVNAQEVRKVFLNYQQLCRNNDIGGIIEMTDLELHRKVFQVIGWDPSQVETKIRESLWSNPEVLQIIATLPIESITLDTTQAEGGKKHFNIEIEEPVMAVKSGKWTWHFRKTAEGWKIINEEYSGDMEEDLKLKETSSAFVETGPEAYVQEVRQAFLNYQQLCKARDIEGILNAFDLDSLAKGNELDLKTVKDLLQELLEGKVEEERNPPIPDMEVMANARIKSIKTINTSEFKIDGPVMAVQVELIHGKIYDVYFHKTADGWKLSGLNPAPKESTGGTEKQDK